MKVTVDFCGGATPTTVTVDGDLDVRAGPEFTQLVMGLHDILGPDVRYDLAGLVARDDAGRAALAMVVHEFREYGPLVTLPEPGAAAEGPTPGR
ncbi:hypothetical protein [Georgenia wangjunii]|uniref:hypothetical protein n=1 Tax=Georgenia wangjunii TaxID=3117730 RepID=UPI002F25FE1F